MLELKDICVSFRSERQDRIFGHTRQQVLFDVSFSVKKGTCLGILGESGSGKSTMGRVLCGLLRPDSGEALLDGIPVYGSRAGRRNLQNKLSVVFQDYTTTANPRFRVKDVIGEGLTVRERREKRRLDRPREIARLLELVGLPADFAGRFPHELSGGMQRRAELVRAMINQPKVMMMDEPFRGLDAMTRALMQEYYVRLFEEHRGTNLFVTSELEEGIILADLLVVLSNQPCQVMKVMDVYLPRPRTFDMMAMPEYVDIKREVLELLHDEAMKSFATGAVNAADFLEAYSQLGQDQAQPRMGDHK